MLLGVFTTISSGLLIMIITKITLERSNTDAALDIQAGKFNELTNTFPELPDMYTFITIFLGISRIVRIPVFHCGFKFLPRKDSQVPPFNADDLFHTHSKWQAHAHNFTVVLADAFVFSLSPLFSHSVMREEDTMIAFPLRMQKSMLSMSWVRVVFLYTQLFRWDLGIIYEDTRRSSAAV